MNKKMITAILVVIAIVVALVLWPSNKAEAADLDVYGELNYKLSNDENSSGNSILKAENNSSKLGVDISEEFVTGDSTSITGFAKLELGVDTDDSGSNPFDSRLAYAGIDFGSAGKLSAGRQASPFAENISGVTDVFEVYGSGADQKLFDRDSNTIAYSSKIGMFEVDSIMKIDGESGSSGDKDGVDVWEYTVKGEFQNVKAAIGYSNDEVNDILYKGIGLSTSVAGLDVAYTHTLKDAATDVAGDEFVVSKTIGSTTFTGGYGKVESSTAYTTAGVQHSVTESLSTYAEYQGANNTGSSVDTNSFSTGIKFSF
jgi:predicted porin